VDVGFEQRSQHFDGYFSENESLHLVAAQEPQPFRLLFGLDSIRKDLVAEAGVGVWRDREDVRAVIAYLRALPSVRKTIPPDRAPAADDCDVYTFWTSESHAAGCQ